MGCRKLKTRDYYRLHPKTAYRFFFDWNHGQMSELHTYRDGLTPDKTIWNYDSATGLLTSKKDATDKSVSYTYDSANR